MKSYLKLISLVTVALLLLLVLSGNGQSQTLIAIEKQPFQDKSAVQDLSFQSDVEVRVAETGFAEEQTLKPASMLRFKLNYYVKGKKTRYDFTSSRVSGNTATPMAHLVGTSVIVSGEEIKIKGPEQKPLSFPLQEMQQGSTFETYPNSGLPQFGGFAHDLLEADDADWQKSNVVGDEKIGDVDAKIYELKFSKPLLLTPPHTISAIRRFVDPQKKVTLREQQLAPTGEIIQTTNYENFQKDDLDNWVALFSRSTVAPTRTSISIPWNTEDGKRDFKQTTIPISGRIIEKQYELVQGAFHLLSSFRMSDSDGNLIMKATFSDFIVNQGIDDSLFDFPDVELKTPAVSQVMPPFSLPDEKGDLQGPQKWAGRTAANVLLLPTAPTNDDLLKAMAAAKQAETLSAAVMPKKPSFTASVPFVVDEENEMLSLIGDKPMLAQIDKAGFVRGWKTVADAKMLAAALETKIEVPAVAVGQSAPDFTLTDMDGQPRRLSELKGKKNLLLTFFPKCFTGGCANHLTSIQNRLDDYKAADTEVWAVSIDPADVQRDFAAMWKFQFPLLPDVGRNLSLLYGAAQNTEQLSDRMSVFIDKAGIVRLVDKSVVVGSHGSDVLKKMDELKLGK